MQGQVAKLKQHYHDCTDIIDDTNDASTDLDISLENIQILSQKRISDISLTPKAKKKKSSTMTNFDIQTSTTEKASIDLQIARFVCATNSLFPLLKILNF